MNLANWALRTSLKFTTWVKYQFLQGLTRSETRNYYWFTILGYNLNRSINKRLLKYCIHKNTDIVMFRDKEVQLTQSYNCYTSISKMYRSVFLRSILNENSIEMSYHYPASPRRGVRADRPLVCPARDSPVPRTSSLQHAISYCHPFIS